MEQIILPTYKGQNNLGGKANKLIQLTQMGLQVPNFIVIPYASLLSFVDDNFLKLETEEQKNAINNCNLPITFLENILQNVNSLYMAVRSSGADEDNANNSFAGQYLSKLFVTTIQLQSAIKDVWLSAYSNTVLQYRQANNLPMHFAINIIVQEMVHATSSGVAFGANPLTGNANECVINSVYGLGEGLVSGTLNADNFVIDKEAKITSTLATKDFQFVLDENGGIKKETVSAALQNQSSLQNVQILEIQKTVKNLDAKLSAPQDVEFAYDAENKLHILQTRPITSAYGYMLQVFDNSNIIESYPGLTSPLTYSFITKMYESVYTQLSYILGIRHQKIVSNKNVYANMLELIKGRVYYNLNNWYASLALLPGYNLNAGFMEKMMGVKEKFEIELEAPKNKLQQWSDVLYAVKKIFITHKNIKRERAHFIKNFDNIMAQYEAMDFSSKSLDELVTLYKAFEHTMVTEWKAPLINDFFAMVYFGLLQKQIKKYNLDAGETLHNELLAGSGDIISTEPANWCLQISQQIKNSTAALELFTHKSETEIWQALNHNNFIEIKKNIEAYLKKWGARCVAELKLETITYNQAPENFIRIIKNYLQHTQVQSGSNYAQQVRATAEEKFYKNLSGIKKIVCKYILKQTRDLVSNRENLRYYRTLGFAMVRNMFLAMGVKMQEQFYITDSRDIFWLTQTEIFECIQNKNAADLEQVIAIRKKQYATWQTQILPERVQTYTNVQQHYFTSNTNVTTNELHGLPCCAGIVEAKVCVLESPLDIDNLQGQILVTSSTDPGWVTLFPTASAILVERGSLLSHSAIVSREMGIPCIVGITGLLQKLKTGDVVRMNGSTGEIEIIKK